MAHAFFLHLPKNRDLLQAELTLISENIRPSFSSNGFSTFIVDSADLKKLQNTPIIFALCHGLEAKRSDTECSVWYENEELYFNGKTNFAYKDNKGQVWVADCPQFASIAKLSQIKQPDAAPSRAYLKIAQAFEYFHRDRDRDGHAIEIGSAPGGASYFLLQQSLKVTGLDPAEMAEICLNNANFIHLKKSVQDVQPKDLSNDYSLMAIDTNLPALTSLRETIRLASWSKKSLNEIFMTIKMPNPRQVRKLSSYANDFKRAGYKVIYKQLPSHHREILLYGYKDVD